MLLGGSGLMLFALGTTLPYAAVFDKAGQIGGKQALGPGTAQGVVSVISAPASAFGPPLIGLLLSYQGNFTLAFGVIALIGLIACIAAFSVNYFESRHIHSSQAPTREESIHESGCLSRTT